MGGELRLEGLDLRAEDEAAVVENPLDCGAQLRAQGLEGGGGVEEGDGDGGLRVEGGERLSRPGPPRRPGARWRGARGRMTARGA
jgi:hypothetical protein